MWVYAETAGHTAVCSGSPLPDAHPALGAGWNLIGVAREMRAGDLAVPEDAHVASVWQWNIESRCYDRVGSEDSLVPGSGYWVELLVRPL